MFDQFHSNLNHLEHFLSYFTTLIPKVHSSHSLGEFLLISLFGSLYELLFFFSFFSKRLVVIIDSLGSNNHLLGEMG